MHEHILVHSFMHTCANTHTCALMYMRAHINIAHSCTHAVYNHVHMHAYVCTYKHNAHMHVCTHMQSCRHTLYP